MPVGRAVAALTSISPITRAGSETRPLATVRAVAPPTSSTLAQAWHSPQRPTHFGLSQPHSTHRYWAVVFGLGFAMPRTLPSVSDRRVVDRQISELASAVILDAAGAARAAAEANAIADAIGASGLPRLAIARGEIWRVQAERERAPHELQPFLPDSDPVLGLTVAERTALALQLRLGLAAPAVAEVFGMSQRRVERLLATARRELARTAIAIALFSNPSRCPVLHRIQANGEVLDRSKALQLVTHAAECAICVPVMRTVDRQIIDDYRDAPAIELPTFEVTDVAALISRAQLQNGVPPKAEGSTNWLRLAFWCGAVSSLLFLLGALLSR